MAFCGLRGRVATRVSGAALSAQPCATFTVSLRATSYDGAGSSKMHASLPRRLLRLPASALIIALVTWIAYASHAKSFVAGFLYLFPVMLLGFGWGFFEATFASVLAVGCLDYFFTEPLLQLSMSDPQDWLAL